MNLSKKQSARNAMSNLTDICMLACYLVIFFALTLSSTPSHAARSVEAKRECATCHIMWLDEFKRKDVTALIPFDPKPVVSTGKQDVASTERMCFSCHDGFVLDSRFLWETGAHSHPVGKKPPKGMKLPTSEGKTIFPLNEDGKMYCGTCHTAHGVDWDSKESPIFMRVKNINSSLCIACHLDKSTGPKEGNHPIFKKPGHTPDGMREAGARFASDGSVICQSCHRPHGGKQDAILVKSNMKSALCYSCHKNKRNLVGSKHDMTKMAPELKNMHGDDVNIKGPCSACHAPHGGKGVGLWSRNIPTGQKDKAAGVCISCHNKHGVAKEKTTGIHSHPIGKTLDKLGIKITGKDWQSKHVLAKGKHSPKVLPLFDKNGRRDSSNKGHVSCPTCHDPHNWSVIDGLKIVSDPKKVEGNGNTSFLRIAQGSDSNLCLNCHVDKRTIKNTTHNIELSRTDEAAMLVNKNDTCAHCHAVHNAKGITLRQFKKEPGKKPIESWCRGCHKKDGLAKNKIIKQHSHPLGVKPTQLDDKSLLPLFDKNGKRIDHNGLVDCATCHNPHQWTQKIEKDTVKVKGKQDKKEGDASNSYLRIPASNDAKLCVTCHKDKATVVGTDHDMRVTAPDAKNIAGHTPEMTGVCGQCHSVHNSILGADLWALQPGDGKDIKEQQCTSCHNKNGKAKAKIPPALRHPNNVIAWSGAIRQLNNEHKLPDIEVFDSKGKHARVGIISCPSCHNPHKWNPRTDKKGSGKNIEGNALTSFLRNYNSEYIVCADCHGKDAIFRYKYFHGTTSRKDYPLYE